MVEHFDKNLWLSKFLLGAFGRARKFFNKIWGLCSLDKSSSVLDVGGGNGLITKYFVGKVKRIVVLDPAQKMLDCIKDSRIEKIKGVAQKIPFKSNSFDLVYCVDTLHHFTNGVSKDGLDVVKLCVKEMVRVLKKDGVLLIGEMEPRGLIGRGVKFFENKVFKMGSLFFHVDELKRLVEEYGRVEVIKCWGSFYFLKVKKSL